MACLVVARSERRRAFKALMKSFLSKTVHPKNVTDPL